MNRLYWSLTSMFSIALIGACTPNNFSSITPQANTNQAAGGTSGVNGGGPAGNPPPPGGSSGPLPSATSMSVTCLNPNNPNMNDPEAFDFGFLQGRVPDTLNVCQLTVDVANATNCELDPLVDDIDSNIKPCSTTQPFVFHWRDQTLPVPFDGTANLVVTGPGGATTISYASRCFGINCNAGLAGETTFPGFPLPVTGEKLPQISGISVACLAADGTYSRPFQQGIGKGLDQCRLTINLTPNTTPGSLTKCELYPPLDNDNYLQDCTQGQYVYYWGVASVPVEFHGTRHFYYVSPVAMMHYIFQVDCSGTTCHLGFAPGSPGAPILSQ